jgi:hypothetical protein
MKNKTKLWRRNARGHNLMAGAKHQGRKWKYAEYIQGGKVGMYPLLQSLMKNAGLIVKIEEKSTN